MLGSERQAGFFHLALKICLGERRPLVGRKTFVTQQRNRAREATLAQCVCSLNTGLASADDYHVANWLNSHNKRCAAEFL